MRSFKSWSSYRHFARAVTSDRRYVRSGEVDAFLLTVFATSRGRVQTIPKDRYLWRAQLGHAWEPHYEDGHHVADVPGPYPPERMKPLKHSAREGRANPKGIPYLYLANRKETAMAEVRPWLGSFISLAQFRPLRELRVVDCSTADGRRTGAFLRQPPPKKRMAAVWANIDRAFSRPVTPSDDAADYVPTQIIAELFRSKGKDGIIYRSAFSGGHNVALFDHNAADLVSCVLYEVKDLNFDFRQAGNPYSVQVRAKDHDV